MSDDRTLLYLCVALLAAVCLLLQLQLRRVDRELVLLAGQVGRSLNGRPQPDAVGRVLRARTDSEAERAAEGGAE